MHEAGVPVGGRDTQFCREGQPEQPRSNFADGPLAEVADLFGRGVGLNRAIWRGISCSQAHFEVERGCSGCPSRQKRVSLSPTGTPAWCILNVAAQAVPFACSHAARLMDLLILINRIVVRRACPRRAKEKLLAIRQRHITAVRPMRTVFGLVAIDNHLLPRLQRVTLQPTP